MERKKIRKKNNKKLVKNLRMIAMEKNVQETQNFQTKEPGGNTQKMKKNRAFL